MNFSVVLLIAGHITTTALLGNAVRCLDAHPEVHADRSLVEATLEEVLRYRSSFTQVVQVTMVETELGGQTSQQMRSSRRGCCRPTATNASSSTPTGSTFTVAPIATWPSVPASTSASASY